MVPYYHWIRMTDFLWFYMRLLGFSSIEAPWASASLGKGITQIQGVAWHP